MRRALLTLCLISSSALAADQMYFQRPVNCPLRFSQLSSLRDQVQSLVSSLGAGCTQNGQQAINQLNSNVASLEGIANSFSDYSTSADATTSTQYAKNVSQILGSINLITSNNACFYDIRSRGFLPVLSDVIMSTSQLGLLIPSTTGTAVAAGGYIAGSGIRIIHQLLKKKFNFDKPEERRAFIQLNCAFFDNRRIMEESGIFNPESEGFRDELIADLRRERIDLLKGQKSLEDQKLELDATLLTAIRDYPEARSRGLNPALSKMYKEVISSLGFRPADYSQKLRQVSFLSERIQILLEGTKNLTLDVRTESSRRLLVATLEKISPDFAPGEKAWTNNIDDYEMNMRGPLFAFLIPVADVLAKELVTVEAEIAAVNPEVGKKISQLRREIQENERATWSTNLRLTSIETKISSLERPQSHDLFSDSDEGASNEVEILDYYRKLQRSILGREGKDYVKNTLKSGYQMKEGLERQILLLDQASSRKERCAAAEKTRFAWAQYRFKVQEAYDFVATNIDLYRSSFRIGKERLKGPTRFVLYQMESVQLYMEQKAAPPKTVGELMMDVKQKITHVETRLQNSGCF